MLKYTDFKNAQSISLVHKGFNFEISHLDINQRYKLFELVSPAPTKEEREKVYKKHHLDPTIEPIKPGTYVSLWLEDMEKRAYYGTSLKDVMNRARHCPVNRKTTKDKEFKGMIICEGRLLEAQLISRWKNMPWCINVNNSHFDDCSVYNAPISEKYLDEIDQNLKWWLTTTDESREEIFITIK